MSRVLNIIIALALIVPGLTGCASKYGEQKTTVNYYPACYAPIQDLRAREHDVGTGTAVGGVIGALGGALVGLLATGKAEGAVMGAAIGGTGGLVAGNIYASKQQQADDNIRLASYLSDLDGDISNLDVTAAAARTSLQCYNRQFAALIEAIKTKRISREGAASRYAEIMSGTEEANAILGQVVTNARDLSQQYEQAFIQEERAIQTPQKVAQNRSAVQANRQKINRGRQTLKQVAKVGNNAQNDLQASKAQMAENTRIYAELAQLEASGVNVEQ